jgi:hypothetical protein
MLGIRDMMVNETDICLPSGLTPFTLLWDGVELSIIL